LRLFEYEKANRYTRKNSFSVLSAKTILELNNIKAMQQIKEEIEQQVHIFYTPNICYDQDSRS